jgi:hypothetical protein
MPAVPEHTEGVCLVEQEQRPVAARDGVQLGDGREAAVHGEHGVADHDGGPLATGGEGGLDGAGVTVRGDLEPDTAASGQAARVDQRGVVARVGDEQHTAAVIKGRGERGHGGEVGQVAGGEHQGARRVAERPELPLKLGVQLGGPGHEARTGRARSPGAGRRGRRRREPGISREPEVVVGRQVERHPGVRVLAGRRARNEPPAQPRGLTFCRRAGEPGERIE